ncbi:unnamed protein product, partial [Acidithrix sp. C25]
VNMAQIMFSIGLGVVSLSVVGFALFVVSTTMWGDKWIRRSPK